MIINVNTVLEHAHHVIFIYLLHDGHFSWQNLIQLNATNVTWDKGLVGCDGLMPVCSTKIYVFVDTTFSDKLYIYITCTIILWHVVTTHHFHFIHRV